MGDIVGINGYRVNRTLLTQRFTEGGYEAHETAHFLIFTRPEPPSTIIVHWFSPKLVDADIGNYFIQELKPLGFLRHPKDFGNVFGAILYSLFPYDVTKALHLYAINTLQSYRYFLSICSDVPQTSSTIKSFARVYQRVFELQIGKSFLDAGCSFGFLPLLVAEHFPTLSQCVGIDIMTDPFPIIRRVAKERQLSNVEFFQSDLLSTNFSKLGRFDTVTALHVLEHFTEEDMYRVLVNLLKVSSKRLILAVPYESGMPEQAYGHEQLFNRDKFEAVGAWCLEHLGGMGRVSYEDCADGLLIVERNEA